MTTCVIVSHCPDLALQCLHLHHSPQLGVHTARYVWSDAHQKRPGARPGEEVQHLRQDLLHPADNAVHSVAQCHHRVTGDQRQHWLYTTVPLQGHG